MEMEAFEKLYETYYMRVYAWLGFEHPLPAFTPSVWTYDTRDGNIKWLILLGCTFVGIILFISGIIKRRK